MWRHTATGPRRFGSGSHLRTWASSYAVGHFTGILPCTMSPEILPCTMPLKISPEILPYAMPLKISPETMPPDILPETMPPDILPEAPAPPRGEKRGDGDPAPPRGEKRGDGDRYTPAAPWEEMVATMLPFPTLIPVDNNDLKSVALSVDVVLVPCPWSLPNPRS